MVMAEYIKRNTEDGRKLMFSRSVECGEKGTNEIYVCLLSSLYKGVFRKEFLSSFGALYIYILMLRNYLLIAKFMPQQRCAFLSRYVLCSLSSLPDTTPVIIMFSMLRFLFET